MTLLERWQNLSVREQITLLSGGAVLLTFFSYNLVWKPLHQHYLALEEQITLQQQSLVAMQEAAQKVTLFRSRAATQSPAQNRSLLAIIDQTLRQAELSQAIRRVEPDGERTVKVWLENAPFDDFIAWLGSLQQKSPISITRLVVDQQEEAGEVNIRATLER